MRVIISDPRCSFDPPHARPAAGAWSCELTGEEARASSSVAPGGLRLARAPPHAELRHEPAWPGASFCAIDVRKIVCVEPVVLQGAGLPGGGTCRAVSGAACAPACGARPHCTFPTCAPARSALARVLRAEGVVRRPGVPPRAGLR